MTAPNFSRTPVGAGWYGVELNGVDPIDSVGRLGAVSLFVRRPRADAYFVQSRTRGVLLLSILTALTGRRRVVLLEFIRVERVGLRGALDFLYVKLLTLGCRGLHVLTHWEVDAYRRRYRIAGDRLHSVLWPLSDDRQKADCNYETGFPIPCEVSSEFVMASGRAACDWRTLIDAQKLSITAWDLLIVCSSDEEEYVRSLIPAKGGVRVLSDVPADLHRSLVNAASVYALVLKEEGRSSGHIRLMESIDSKTPVVASNTLGLRGYAIDNCTARLVPVGDSEALACTVDALMTGLEARSELVESAAAFSKSRTFTSYLEEIRELADAK